MMIAVNKYSFKKRDSNPPSPRHYRRSNYRKPLSRLGWITIVMSVSLMVGLSGAVFLNFLFPETPSLHDDILPDSETLRDRPDDINSSVETGSLDRTEPSVNIKKNWFYNVTSPPHFKSSAELQSIVNEAVDLAKNRGLSTDSLSIHLIDLTRYTEAGYQSDFFRYPASITKLFWMVAYYSLQADRNIPHQSIDLPQRGCLSTICKLIQKSDNEAASRIVDFLTDTTSISHTEDYETWLNKRYSINYFFEKSGYSGINVSQKNFPIPYLGMDSPQGWDLQMRGDTQSPIRNKMTARHAARLMSEIATYQAVSKPASMQMMTLLKRDLDPQVWEPEEYDSVEGFLGQGIYKKRQYIDFYSKVGWTHDSRLEVAFIQHKYKNKSYIISVFGDGVAYGEDWEFFPIISQLVYERMFGSIE